MKKREETKNSVDVFDSVVDGSNYSEFNHVEPFDIGPRSPEIMEQARLDNVELNPGGDPFQLSMLLDEDNKNTFTGAGSQVGKSYGHAIEAIIMASRSLPVALRYDRGVDTGVKRLVSPANVNRFGLNAKGDCGNIIGVGKYPSAKIPTEPGEQIWICTFKHIAEVYWIPVLKRLIPGYLLETDKGVDGFSSRDSTFFFHEVRIIKIVTYEQGYKRAEGRMAWMVVLDEEPPDRRFFTGIVEHCRWLRECFTPINGLSWSYQDVYLPARRRESSFKLYYCSQYDSPYQKIETITKNRKLLKDYEIKAKVWGQFSEMSGKPYYDYAITAKYLRDYTPLHTLARISPYDFTLERSTVKEMLKSKMRAVPSSEPGPDVWQIYEPDVKQDTAYWMSMDCARGDADPDKAQDSSVAYVRRFPDKEGGDPLLVASLRTTDRNVEFAWMCLYAAVYYNYCMIAPEVKGEDGKVVLHTLFDYPFIYRQIVINDKTRRPTEIRGFDTNPATRKPLFDCVGTWIVNHQSKPGVNHFELLKEMVECIVGKQGRPDHANNGSTDCLVAFGISEYIWQHARSQIRNNRMYRLQLTGQSEKKDSLFPCLLDRLVGRVKPKGCIGSETGLIEGRRNGKST